MGSIPIANKALGQHWLEDHAALQAMVDAAGLNAGDAVLEIGPGYGTLTDYLLAAGAEVTALEFDHTLMVQLLSRFANIPEITIQQGDIRTYDFTAQPKDYAIVANIPYYLTSNLIQLISETPNRPRIAVLLMQKEVAERICAQPGDMSLLSITAQFYWEASLDMVVGAELFTPPPKVDSQILVLQRRAQPLFEDVDAKRFFRLVKAGFSQKRKTLLNSLGAGLALSRDETAALLQAAAVDPGRRAQTLALDEWYALYSALQKHS